MPHAWWARRQTLVAVGGTALAVWLLAGAWMLFAPADRDTDPVGPGGGTSQPGLPAPTTSSGDSSYDPGVYEGPLNTPGFTPKPSTGPTGSPTGTATSGTSGPGPTSGPPPAPTTTTSTPTWGPGNGHGHGHGPKH